MPAREFSAKTWSLDFLSKSSSSRVPQFIISWFCNSTHREQAVHSTSIVQRLFDSSVYFQCWDTARKHAGCQTGNQALLAGILLLSVKANMCPSETHLGENFGCLRKHCGCCFSAHYRQYWSPGCDFSEETLHLHLLTRRCAHRTPSFMTYCRVKPLTAQWSTSAHPFLCGKVQCVPSE